MPCLPRALAPLEAVAEGGPRALAAARVPAKSLSVSGPPLEGSRVSHSGKGAVSRVVDAGRSGHGARIAEPYGPRAAVRLPLSGLRARRPGRGPHEFSRARHVGDLPEVRPVRSCRLARGRPGRRRLPRRLPDDRCGLHPAKAEGAQVPAPGRALRDRGWGRAGGGRSDPVPVAVGSVTVPVTRCRQCASPQVSHLWPADMAHLNLIDQWKCLDIRCGHRWDTTVTYAQLQDADLSRSGPADDDAIPVGRQESDAMSDSG
jgi:hypothetical protein